MRIRPTVGLVILVVSLFAAGLFAAGQQQKPPTFALPQMTVVPLTAPVILSGSDVGFRVESYSGKIPVGRVVVFIDGKWVEPLPPPPRVVLAK
jgi:hypothetical protein